MISLDSNIVAVSLPSIARALEADFTAIEWVISALHPDLRVAAAAGRRARRSLRPQAHAAARPGDLHRGVVRLRCRHRPHHAQRCSGAAGRRRRHPAQCRPGDALARVPWPGPGTRLRLLGLGDRRRHLAGADRRRLPHPAVRLAVGVLCEPARGRCHDPADPACGRGIARPRRRPDRRPRHAVVRRQPVPHHAGTDLRQSSRLAQPTGIVRARRRRPSLHAVSAGGDVAGATDARSARLSQPDLCRRLPGRARLCRLDADDAQLPADLSAERARLPSRKPLVC